MSPGFASSSPWWGWLVFGGAALALALAANLIVWWLRRRHPGAESLASAQPIVGYVSGLVAVMALLLGLDRSCTGWRYQAALAGPTDRVRSLAVVRGRDGAAFLLVVGEVSFRPTGKGAGRRTLIRLAIHDPRTLRRVRRLVVPQVEECAAAGLGLVWCRQAGAAGAVRLRRVPDLSVVTAPAARNATPLPSRFGEAPPPGDDPIPLGAAASSTSPSLLILDRTGGAEGPRNEVRAVTETRDLRWEHVGPSADVRLVMPLEDGVLLVFGAGSQPHHAVLLDRQTGRVIRQRRL